MKISQIGHFFSLKLYLFGVRGTGCALGLSQQHKRHTEHAWAAHGHTGRAWAAHGHTGRQRASGSALGMRTGALSAHMAQVVRLEPELHAWQTCWVPGALCAWRVHWAHKQCPGSAILAPKLVISPANLFLRVFHCSNTSNMNKTFQNLNFNSFWTKITKNYFIQT